MVSATARSNAIHAPETKGTHMGRTALPDNAAAKAAAQYLLRQGLATYVEIAALSGVSRQTIRFWAIELDAESAREKHLAKIWQDALHRAK